MTHGKGKHLFMQSLIAQDVRYIFGNPGTTETPLLDCLADYPQIEYILTLHEGVAVGAADAYALAADRVGVVNLHVAPGLGNGLGMLYNACTGRSPVIVTAGEPDTRLRLRDPLLSHDLVAMAAPLTKWSVRAERADELPLILHRAFNIAQNPPSGPVFVALPVNVMEEETDVRPFPPTRPSPHARPDPDALQDAATLLLQACRPVIVCGAGVARAQAQTELVALAERLSAPVWNTLLTSAVNFPMRHPLFRGELTDNHAHIRHCLGDPDVVLLVGGHFFAEVFHTPTPPWPAEAAVIQVEAAPAALAHNFSITVGLAADLRESLRELEAQVAAGAMAEFQADSTARWEAYVAQSNREQGEWEKRLREGWDHRPMTVARLMTELGAALPSDVVVVSEVNTGRRDLIRAIPFERPSDYYGSRGGGIGQGLPGALGCRLAHPDRPILALSSDGSSLYSLQALWTAAHYRMPITFVILNNRAYQIVKQNLDRYRDFFDVPGSGYPHLDLTDPDIDYVQLAQGFGLPARRVEDPAEIGPAVRAAFEMDGPYLLDVPVNAAP